MSDIADKLEFTPGPWKKDYGNTKGHIKSIAPNDKGWTPTVCKYSEFSHLPIDMPFNEVEANGYLIAAAPEMLEDEINNKEDAHTAMIELEKEVPDLQKVFNLLGNIVSRSANGAEKAINKICWEEIKEIS